MGQAQKGGDPYNAAVAAQLKAKKDLTGVSYLELTEKTGISRQTLMAIFLNKRPMKLADFFKLLPALELDASKVADEAERVVREDLSKG